MKRFFCCVFLWSFLAGPVIAEPGGQAGIKHGLNLDVTPRALANRSTSAAIALLDQMSRAVQNLNYQGTFVYLHDGQLETMRIIHRMDDSGERERLVSLNGAAREVLRDNESVTCILPDNQSVMVDTSHPRKPFPAALPEDLKALTRNYKFQLQGEDRIAGLDAQIIAIKPRDRFRYGYRMWIDKHSKVLLKSDLTDARGRAVEQIMFTEFSLRDDIPNADLEPALSGEGYTRHDVESETDKKERVVARKINSKWQLDRVPKGFMLVSHSRHRLPSSPKRVEHMVYSDGMASVSVFVSSTGTDKSELDGTSSMGAVNAFGVNIGPNQITVVGEVPMATVKMMGNSARLRMADGR